MSEPSNNRLYKVTSLFIKTAILIISFWYIFQKLSSTSEQFNILALLRNADLKLLLLTFLLLFLNWGIEALKWRYLIADLEPITMNVAMRSVFAGVTVSIFMPNRIGEFAGRIFFLEKADKVKATLKNFTGSLLQFAITLVLGLGSLLWLTHQPVVSDNITGFFDNRMLKLAISLLLIFFAGLLILNRYRTIFPERIQSLFSAVFDMKAKEISIVFFLSLVRYTVFIFQYYLVLRAFGVKVDPVITLNLIALAFLITSVVPSFALTEIATRGAAAVFLFGNFMEDTSGVLAASFVVWFINLAIPAMIGAAFVGKLKFFNS